VRCDARDDQRVAVGAAPSPRGPIPPRPGAARFSTIEALLELIGELGGDEAPDLVSALPPGPKGTMILTGLAGHGCAAGSENWEQMQRRARNRVMRRFINHRMNARLHRHPHARRAGNFPAYREPARRALAVDAPAARVSPARDYLRQVYRTVADGSWSVPRRIEDMGAMRHPRARADLADAGAASYWLPLADAKVMIRYLNDQMPR